MPTTPRPTVINVLLVRTDAATISTQAHSWREAAAWALDRAARQQRPQVERVFMSDGRALEEHTLPQLRDDLEAGRLDLDEVFGQ